MSSSATPAILMCSISMSVNKGLMSRAKLTTLVMCSAPGTWLCVDPEHEYCCDDDVFPPHCESPRQWTQQRHHPPWRSPSVSGEAAVAAASLSRPPLRS